MKMKKPPVRTYPYRGLFRGDRGILHPSPWVVNNIK